MIRSFAASCRSFFGMPLLRREVLSILRTRTAFWVAFCCFMVSCLIPLTWWPSEQMGALQGFSNVYVFLMFFQVQLTAAVFLTPMVTGGAIAGERERDTLDALYMAPISPFSILASKVIAALVYGGILLAVSAPAVLTLYLLGGLTFEAILASYAVTFAGIAVASLVGIAQSMRSRRTAHAVVRGIVWVLLWIVGLPLAAQVGMILEMRSASTAPSLFSPWILLSCMSPHVALSAAVLGESLAGSIMPYGPVVVFLAWAAALSLVLLLYLARAARKPDLAPSRRRERRRAALAKASGQPSRRGTLFTEWLISGGYEGLPLLRNPIFVKEVRAEFHGRKGFRRGLFWGSLALFLILCWLSSWGRGRDQILTVACAAAAIILLVVPAVTASAFPREAEHGNLDFLRGTHLSLREVLAGKLLAGILSHFGIFAAAAWVILVVDILGAGTWNQGEPMTPCFPGALMVLALTLFFTVAVSSLASVLVRRSVGAIVLAYVVLCGATLLSTFLGFAGRSEVFLAMNPFGALWAVVSGRVGTHAFFFVFTHGLGGFGCLGLAANHVEGRFGRDR